MRRRQELIVEPVGVEVDSLPRPVDHKLLFGNDHPLEVEIGTGKGTFLAEQAKRNLGVNFLGLERTRRYWQYAADRLRRNHCLNARVVLTEAVYFLTELVTDGSVSAIHIYFPDPWPKTRHHKRRLLQPSIVEQLERVLEPGGRLQVVSDHGEYFAQIERVVRASGLTVTEYRPPPTTTPGELVGSNFERKYRRQGRSLHAIAAVKRSSGNGFTTAGRS